jgi:hypothetical protein
MGDTTEYKTEGNKTISNGVVVVRSLHWLSLKKLGMIERWRSLAEKDNWAPKSSS